MIKKILSYFLVRSLGYIQNQDFVDPHNLLADGILQSISGSTLTESWNSGLKMKN
jgi:hypothetical protein